MSTTEQTLGMKVVLNTTFDDAIARVTEALKAEGFGVLTEIDVKATMKKKLDEDYRPYTILGACNPSLAHRALSIDRDIGMLLPCNVVVSELDDDTVQVGMIDPLVMLGVVASPEIAPVADDARARLERVKQALESS